MRFVYLFFLILIAINTTASDMAHTESNHLHETHIHSHDQHNANGDAAGHHHCCHAHGHHYLAEQAEIIHNIKKVANQALPVTTFAESQRPQPPTPPPKQHS